MMNSKEFLVELKKNGFVFPDYKNSNLSAIKTILIKANGTENGKKAKKVILMVDGLGYNLIKNMLKDKEARKLLEGAKVEKVSTTFPSTTVSVFTTLETGLTPAEHGIIGWHTYSKGIGMVIVPYRDIPSLSRELDLNRAGVASILPDPLLLIKASRKGRIMMLYDEKVNDRTGKRIQNSEQEGYATCTDMMIKLRDAMKQDKCHLIYVYYPMIDHLEHEYGPSSEAVKREVNALFRELKEVVLPGLRKCGYNLIITSDHGQIEGGKEIKIDSESRIMRYLTGPPWGDSRIIFVNMVPGREKKLEEHFNKEYGKDLFIIGSDAAIASGIFGKPKISPQVRYRFGTHMIFAKGRNTIFYAYPKINQRKGREMKGFHSGLTADEMEIPLIRFG